ncbi:MAG: hypothetical protein PHX02_07065 [Oscillospiraceae bacterium]|jgi:hypothetical protein|nr:hypothetical protein [Oscillospiraceae bacterium]
MKRLVSIILIACSIFLMLLTKSIAMTFAPGPTERTVLYFSHFSLTPVGYGNPLPMLSLLFSVVALVLNIISTRKNIHSLIVTNIVLSIICLAFSWIVFSSFTVWSLVIMILQAISLFTFIVTSRSYQP